MNNAKKRLISLSIVAFFLGGCVIVPPGYGERGYHMRYYGPRVVVTPPRVVVVRPYW